MYKSLTQKLKSYRQDIKMKIKSLQFFFIMEICQDYEILGDFIFFPHENNKWKKNSFTMLDWVLRVDSMLGHNKGLENK